MKEGCVFECFFSETTQSILIKFVFRVYNNLLGEYDYSTFPSNLTPNLHEA